MKPTLVAGIGSPFGADRLGWQVIDRLESDHRFSDCCELRKLDRPGANLVSILQDYPSVVLIDAVQSEQPRGTCIQFDAGQISQQARGLSSHDLGVAEAVALAQALQQLPEQLMLFGLAVGESPDKQFQQQEYQSLVERVEAFLLKAKM